MTDVYQVHLNRHKGTSLVASFDHFNWHRSCCLRPYGLRPSGVDWTICACGKVQLPDSRTQPVQLGGMAEC